MIFERLRSRIIFALLFLSLGASTVRAQFVSVYGLFTPTHVSNVQTGSTYAAGSGYTNQYSSFWAPGFGAGLTLNMVNLHVIKLGIDARGGTRPGNSNGFTSADVSLRLAAQPPVLRLKPYVQAGAGYLETRTGNVSTTSSGTATVGGTFTNRYITATVRGGVDIPVAPFIDLRAIEVGGGHAFNTGLSFSSGSNSTGNNANLFTVATGVVLHF